MVLKKFIKIISVILVSLIILNFNLNAKVRDNDAYFSKQEGKKIIDKLKDLGKTDYDYEHFYYYYPGELMWYVQKCLKNENNEINYAWKNLDQIAKLITYELGSKILNYKNQAVNTVICNSYGNPNLQSELEQSISGIFEILKNIYGDTELQNTQKHILKKLKDSEVISNPNELVFYKKFIEDALNDSLGPIINLYNKDFSKVIITIPASKFALLEIVGDDEYSYLTKFEKIDGKIRKEEINNLIEYEFINEYVIQKEKEKLIKKKEEEKKRQLSFEKLSKLPKEKLKKLQENFKLLGLYQSTVDGIFGEETLSAFKKWIESKEYEDIYKEEYLEEITKDAEQSEIAIKKQEEEERNRKLIEENNRNDLLNEIDQLNQSIQELKNKILSINPYYSDLISNNKVSSNNLEEKVISENANNKPSDKEELTLPSENIVTIPSSKKFIANIQQNNICVGNICLYDTLDDVMKFRSEPANCDYASTEKLCLGEQCISKNEIDTKDAFEDEYWCRDPSRFKKSSEINADLALYFEAEQSVYDALSQDDYDTNVWTFQLSENSYKNLNKVKSWCTYAPRLLGIFNTESGNNISLYLLPDEEFEYYVAGIEVIYNNFLNSKNEYSLTHQIDIYNAIVKKYKKVLGTNVKYTNRINQTLDYNGLYPLYEKYGTQIEASPTIKGNKTYFFLDSGYSPSQQEPIYLSVYNEILEYTRNWNPDNEINYLFNVSANQGESEYCKNLSSGEINID